MMTPDHLAKLRRDAFDGHYTGFSPAVVQDLIAEIDRLAAENADLTQRMERASKIAAEMGAIIRGNAA